MTHFAEFRLFLPYAFAQNSEKPPILGNFLGAATIQDHLLLARVW